MRLRTQKTILDPIEGTGDANMTKDTRRKLQADMIKAIMNIGIIKMGRLDN